MQFELKSQFKPTGDQPEAIEKIVEGFKAGNHFETLLGVTGSGKTFTMANVIQNLQRPTLILAHNKTLAAQLYSEMKEFFPDNAVEYFVSYYDYYQPEAYVPSTDTYIAKDSSINDEIDRLRHSATAALTEREDVIIVSSVSCIYGLGSPIDYKNMTLSLRPGMTYERDDVIRKLISIQYDRNDMDFHRGTFRVHGDVVEIMPAGSAENGVRIEFFGDEVDRISEFDKLTGEVKRRLEHTVIFPASHYVVGDDKMERAIAAIEEELAIQEKHFRSEDKLLEAQRITERTNFDVEMLRETGFCSGIENYSRHLVGNPPGATPHTLMDYFPEDFLLIVDESHMTIPQVRAMYNGDQARKHVLVDYGFRLPSALDNRPLNFAEFEGKVDKVMFTSATPAAYEAEKEELRAEQILRPTGLLDPLIEVRPVEGQIDDLIAEIRKATCVQANAASDGSAEQAQANAASDGSAEQDEQEQTVKAAPGKVLVTTLTKRMAEDLTEYLREAGIKVRYLHSDVDTLERIEIIRDMRLGVFDVLVGINLLREGLDIPEVSLVAIIDADKEGFLRSETSLIQTVGRAARNADGHVIMYADTITDSMRKTLDITNYRRGIQDAYNKEHGITPTSICKAVRDTIRITEAVDSTPTDEMAKDFESMDNRELEIVIAELKKKMGKAASDLDFERAAMYRDKMIEAKSYLVN